MKKRLTAPIGLVEAFSASNFEVLDLNPTVLRFDDSPGTHDFWLSQYEAQSAVVITAWNPFSEATSLADNEAANQRLFEEITQSELKHLPARGTDPKGDWFEDSYCVFDAPDATLERWLLDFRQHAAFRVLVGVGGDFVWHPKHWAT